MGAMRVEGEGGEPGRVTFSCHQQLYPTNQSINSYQQLFKQEPEEEDEGRDHSFQVISSLAVARTGLEGWKTALEMVLM